LALLGIGPNGQVLGICPEKSKADFGQQYTSVAEIGEATASHLNPAPRVPFVVTIGLANILKNVRHVLVPLAGASKAVLLKRILHTRKDPSFPPHILRHHQSLTFIVDNDAAGASLRHYPKEKILDSQALNFDELFS
jgi:6-phosphogluconolactonase/glucosamine-6-phosphate isomerase/deaminase